MKFSINKNKLADILKITEHFSAVKNVQLVLMNIFIEAKSDNSIIVKSSDLEKGVVLKQEATVTEPGKITLPSKKITEIVLKLNDNNEEIFFESNEENQNIKITCGRSKFELLGISPLEYPVIIEEDTLKESEEFVTLETEAFLKALKQTVYATNNGDTNNILTGVFCNVNENNLEMAATDGNRLAKAVLKINNKENKTFENVIPSKILTEFPRFIQGMEDKEFTIYKKNGQLIFKAEGRIMISRSLEGKYPKYNQLIPTNNEKVISCDKEELINSLELTSSVNEEKTNIVKLIFEKGKLSIKADNPELGGGDVVIDSEYNEEDELKIAFNCRYLLDALKSFETEKVILEIRNSSSAVVIKPSSEDEYLALVMPVQIRE